MCVQGQIIAVIGSIQKLQETELAEKRKRRKETTQNGNRLWKTEQT